MPVPAGLLAASERARVRAFWDSRLGRERVYSDIPTAAELAALSLPLAVDANQILAQSEDARRSVLIGIGLPPSLDPAELSDIPENVSSAAVGSAGTAPKSPTMPAAAPVLGPGGLWLGGRNSGYGESGTIAAGGTLSPVSGTKVSPRQTRATIDAGPGCVGLSPNLRVAKFSPGYSTVVPPAKALPAAPPSVPSAAPVASPAPLPSPAAPDPNCCYSDPCPPGTHPCSLLTNQLAQLGRPAPATAQQIIANPTSVNPAGVSGYQPDWGQAAAFQASPFTGSRSGWLAILIAAGAVLGVGLIGKRGGR